MSTIFNLLALSAICATMALPTAAAETDKEQSFKHFIGLGPKDSSLPIVTICLVEEKFQSTEPTDSIPYVSPNLSCNSKTIIPYEPLEVYIFKGVYNDVSQIPDNLSGFKESASVVGGELCDSLCKNEGNKLIIQEVRYNSAETHSVQVISTKLTQPMASYLDRAEKAITAPLSQGSDALMLAADTDFPLLAPHLTPHRGYIEAFELMRSKLNSKWERFEEDCCAHADEVDRILRLVAPKTRTKMFSIYDFKQMAVDKDLDIISISTFKNMSVFKEGSPLSFDGSLDMDGFDAFNDSNKIVVVGLPNNHCQITAKHPYVTLAKRARGYHLIFCSSSTYFADEQLGNIGDYLTLDVLENPDMKEFLACYMTAPGFYLDFVDNTKVLNGCSFSTPIFAGAAGYLKALYPHAPNVSIKEALIQGARKRTTYEQPLDITESTQKNFLEVVANYRIELAENWENQISDEYKRVVQLIESENLLPNDTRVHNRTVFSHVWGSKDYNKYWNHLDIEKSEVFLKNCQRFPHLYNRCCADRQIKEITKNVR